MTSGTIFSVVVEETVDSVIEFEPPTTRPAAAAVLAFSLIGLVCTGATGVREGIAAGGVIGTIF
jgi:hypothetical protein